MTQDRTGVLRDVGFEEGEAHLLVPVVRIGAFEFRQT